MSDRESIARKVMEQAGEIMLGPAVIPMRKTELKPTVWAGIPQTAPATAQYNPYAAFSPSPDIEDRRGEIGGARRAMGIRTGIDREPAFIPPWVDQSPPPNDLSRAAGIEQVDAAAEAAKNREIAAILAKLPPLTEEEMRSQTPMTDEEKREAGIPVGP